MGACTVPRYYLQLRDELEEIPDLNGAEYTNHDDLVATVLRNARDVIAGDAQRGVIDLRFRIDAETETGQLVHSLAFADAIEILRAA